MEAELLLTFQVSGALRLPGSSGLAGTLEGFTFARLGPEFSLKPGVVPGRYFDVPYVEAAEMAEDGVGRAAMLATAATMVALLPQAVLTT